ncbi:MAG: hypothetical protein KAR23_04745, partial [Candidatus Aenigmarchaeota archaeon]|nr:hypothetical protein [Candidatus Aenigmarchaeota archaeon]
SYARATTEQLFSGVVADLEACDSVFKKQETLISKEPDAGGFYDIIIPFEVMQTEDHNPTLTRHTRIGHIRTEYGHIGFFFNRSDSRSMLIYLGSSEGASIESTVGLILTERNIKIKGAEETEVVYLGKIEYLSRNWVVEMKKISDEIYLHPGRTETIYSLVTREDRAKA